MYLVNCDAVPLLSNVSSIEHVNYVKNSSVSINKCHLFQSMDYDHFIFFFQAIDIIFKIYLKLEIKYLHYYLFR